MDTRLRDGVTSKERERIKTLEWEGWFNHYRLMEGLGYISPAEYEANYDWQLAKERARETEST